MANRSANAFRVLRLLGGVLLATLAVLALGGARPLVAAAGQGQPPASIEGAWIVSFPDFPEPGREAVVVGAGGIIVASGAPVTTFPPGEGPPGVTRLFSSQGFGAWASLGSREYSFRFVTINYTDAGEFAGTTTIEGTVLLDASGDAFSGSFTGVETDVAGNVGELFGPFGITGTRIRAPGRGG